MRDAAGATSAADPEHDTESPKSTEPAELDDGVPTIVIRTSDAAEQLDHGGRNGHRDAPPSIVAATPVDEPPPPPSPGLLRALEKMRSVFHIRDLRPGQAEIIESVLAGRDTLAIMPTGSGKSLTYQLPALVLEGPTLVVSPLLALIEDQYSKLKAAGVAGGRASIRPAPPRSAPPIWPPSARARSSW